MSDKKADLAMIKVWEFARYKEGDIELPWHLPAVVYSLLTDYIVDRWNGFEQRKSYASEQDAEEALQRATQELTRRQTEETMMNAAREEAKAAAKDMAEAGVLAAKLGREALKKYKDMIK